MNNNSAYIRLDNCDRICINSHRNYLFSPLKKFKPGVFLDDVCMPISPLLTIVKWI